LQITSSVPVSAVHVALSKVLLALTALHMIAALWHLFVKRDGTVEGIQGNVRATAARNLVLAT
jgi:cytochrome b561